jgi:hypothetical protein
VTFQGPLGARISGMGPAVVVNRLDVVTGNELPPSPPPTDPAQPREGDVIVRVGEDEVSNGSVVD